MNYFYLEAGSVSKREKKYEIAKLNQHFSTI
jgi:hypothetical protein